MASSARNRQAELQKLQAQYQTQQDIITTGITIGQQIGPNVLKDMAAAAAEDPAMKAVLAKHGYNPDAAAGSVPK